MNTILYYFTGTGNSLAVAREIAKYTDAELIGIPSALKNPAPIPKDATVGVVFPLYAGGLPNIVVQFLKTVNLQSAGYTYSIATEGGRIGFPKRQASNLFAAAGHPLDAAWWIQMPDNYLPFGNPPKTAEQKAMYDTANTLLLSIAHAMSCCESI